MTSQTPKLQVFISDYELERVLDQAVKAAINEQVGQSIEKHLDAVISEVLVHRIRAVTDEMVRAEVGRVLTEGWAKTNQWGEKQGEAITLASIVRDGLKPFLEGNPHSYNAEDKKPKVQRIVEEFTASEVKKAMQPVIDEAKRQLQSQLDISIGKSLRLTLADALKGP
ncbi:MAG: hypothetical protein SFW67_28580 [Myxococcaceae bacterium]|nr:hypothetical protein [Myxococcaceae bacterium]